ncbi:RRP15-like protein isoform X2 [Lineus longissimus]|uniref:RRP15-like protein isoform X2 n=1 Tax=Lineus longissimus TaxID=88925 RepID=UPI00315D7E8F
MSAPMVEVAYENSSSNASSDESEGEIEHEHESLESMEDVANPEAISEATDEKAGLADVLAKILTKKTAQSNVILSKGKSDRLIQKDRSKKKSEEEGADQNESSFQIKTAKQMKKQLWEEMGRVKPDITKKEHERNLQRIATRGVVQLFNAVKKQQKLIEDRLKEAGSTTKKSKVLSSMTKGAFLDVLKNTHTAEDKKSEKPGQTFSKVNLNSGDEKPTWSVLRDDFMMSAKMKDWDKNSESDAADERDASDISMSDG